MTEDDSLEVHPVLSLLDWKRRVHELYASVRGDDDPRRAWKKWREERDHLFRNHPRSPLPESERATFSGLKYFDYDERARVGSTFEPAVETSTEVPGSTGTIFGARRVGDLVFELYGAEHRLGLFWIGRYGGGALLAFRDGTSGAETYGGGRYLLDTVKGADLGAEGNRPILDLNFAYNPSCSYDPRWECPLPPAGNILGCDVRAGERLPEESASEAR